MTRQARLAEAVEFHPRAAPCRARMEGLVSLRLCVHPDECGGRHPGALEQIELGDGGGARARVRGDGQAGFAMRQRRGGHQLRVDGGERTSVHADLHERRLDPRVVDAALVLAHPSGGELLGGLVERVRREVLVVRRAVVAGVRQDVEPRGRGQPAQQPRIAPEVGRRALDQRVTSQPPDLLQVRQHRREYGVRVVARGTDLGGADEIDEDVLVHERDAEPIRGDRAGDRIDRARPPGGGIRSCGWRDAQPAVRRRASPASHSRRVNGPSCPSANSASIRAV